MRKFLVVALVLLVLGGCVAAAAVPWVDDVGRAMTVKKGMNDSDVANYCNDEGMKLIAQGKRRHACGMFKQAAENGKPENYRTYCDYNWKPEE